MYTLEKLYFKKLHLTQVHWFHIQTPFTTSLYVNVYVKIIQKKKHLSNRGFSKTLLAHRAKLFTLTLPSTFFGRGEYSTHWSQSLWLARVLIYSDPSWLLALSTRTWLPLCHVFPPIPQTKRRHTSVLGTSSEGIFEIPPNFQWLTKGIKQRRNFGSYWKGS